MYFCDQFACDEVVVLISTAGQVFLQPRPQGLSSSLPWSREREKEGRKEGKKRGPGDEVGVPIVFCVIMANVFYSIG